MLPPKVIFGTLTACAFGALVIYSLRTGRTITKGGPFVSREESPFWYWLLVSIYAAITAIALYGAVVP